MSECYFDGSDIRDLKNVLEQYMTKILNKLDAIKSDNRDHFTASNPGIIEKNFSTADSLILACVENEISDFPGFKKASIDFEKALNESVVYRCEFPFNCLNRVQLIVPAIVKKNSASLKYGKIFELIDEVASGYTN
ncbi:MAG: hypothetical protein FVQ80_18365 [Planctomycetes bacterium]|nr:hypothetical protein [Planctomycetota bacterium]